jgi:hypothetical protein
LFLEKLGAWSLKFEKLDAWRLRLAACGLQLEACCLLLQAWALTYSAISFLCLDLPYNLSGRRRISFKISFLVRCICYIPDWLVPTSSAIFTRVILRRCRACSCSASSYNRWSIRPACRRVLVHHCSRKPDY